MLARNAEYLRLLVRAVGHGNGAQIVQLCRSSAARGLGIALLCGGGFFRLAASRGEGRMEEVTDA
jgi:hypothetical protein